MSKMRLQKLKNPKNIMFIGLIFLVVSFGVLLILEYTMPFAIAPDGSKVEEPWVVKIGKKEAFLVADEKQGKKIINDLKKTYYKDPAAVKAATTDPEMTVEPKELVRGAPPRFITSEKKAVKKIVAANKTKEPMVSVLTTQQVTEKKAIKYKVKVKKTGKLYKGVQKVKKKGKKGKGTITSQVVWKNGKVVSETVLETVVVEEPVAAVVQRGTKKIKAGDLTDSVKGGTIMGKGSGKEVVNFAMQFIGNPYVYGGSSLTKGTDCSGFTMSVYAHFGVSLPHSSSAQRSCGKAVSYSEAKPGDILCYSGHVALYIGNGRIVHASTPRSGIITGNAKYRTILTVRRIIE